MAAHTKWRTCNYASICTHRVQQSMMITSALYVKQNKESIQLQDGVFVSVMRRYSGLSLIYRTLGTKMTQHKIEIESIT
jgi:hypothetical protein